MTSRFDDVSLYPPVKGLKPRRCRRAPCFRCGAGTTVGYVTRGKLWPTCLHCARRAAAIPCRTCGDTTPVDSRSWTRSERYPEGHSANYHESGRWCFPLDAREDHAVPCSSCGAELRLRVYAMTGARIMSGLTDELRCGACGSAWKLSETLPEVTVQLGSVA